jgi:hypothetical protein
MDTLARARLKGRGAIAPGCKPISPQKTATRARIPHTAFAGRGRMVLESRPQDAAEARAARKEAGRRAPENQVHRVRVHLLLLRRHRDIRRRIPITVPAAMASLWHHYSVITAQEKRYEKHGVVTITSLGRSGLCTRGRICNNCVTMTSLGPVSGGHGEHNVATITS